MNHRSSEGTPAADSVASIPERVEQPVYILRLDESGTADQLDLVGVLQFLWRNAILIGTLTAIGILAGFAWIKIATRVYSAEVVMSVLSDAEDASLGGSLPAGVAGLASLAGVQLGGDRNSRDEALALLKSRSFIEQFIEDEQLLPVLFFKRWNESEKKWTGAPQKRPPSLQDGFERFSRGVMRVTDDRKTGLATLRIQWSDRLLAASWANKLVARADKVLRERAVEQADSAMQFLSSELENTSIVEVRQALNSVMVRQTQKRMLARTRPEFAFRTVDPARPSDAHRFVRPKIVVSLVAGMALGLLFGIGTAMIRGKVGAGKLGV